MLYSFCDHYSSTSSFLNLLSHSFSSLCPPYQSFTGYMCVRNKSKEFYVSCMHVLVILWPFWLDFINFECVKWFFSSMCRSCRSFTCFMFLRIKLKKVWAICIQVVVILWPFFGYFINFEPLSHSFSSLYSSNKFHRLYVRKKQVQGRLY